MEVRRDPRQFLFLIILLILLNSPEPQNPGFSTRSRYDEVIDREWEQLEILNTTKHGDFGARNNTWLNITGLREEDGFMWDALSDVKSRARERMRGVFGDRTQGWLNGETEQQSKEMVYRNISGFVQGEWVRSPLSRIRHPVDMNISTGPPEFASLAEFDRNLTGSHGMVRLHLMEMEGRQWTDEARRVSEVKAKVVIGDEDSWGKNWWEFNVNGVHFPDFGGAVLTTTSERFGGIFALPHFQLSSHLYSQAQELLNLTIHDTIQRQLDRPYPIWNPWSSAVEGAAEGTLTANHCEFILYLQEAPIQFDPKQHSHHQKLLGGQLESDWLEHELRYPTGAPLPSRSAMAMSMIGYSPDCGFVIESKGPPDYPPTEGSHLLGSKTEEFNDQARQIVIAFAATLAFQLYFIIKQAKEAATPSTLNRISFYTLAMMALGDGFMFLALIFLHLFIGGSELGLYSVAFLALFSVILELRFLMDIWKIQVTEQLRQDRQQGSARTAPTPPPPPPSDTLPLPVTANRAQTPSPVIVPSDQDDVTEGGATRPTANPPSQAAQTRIELGTLYSRFCFMLVIIFFATLQFTTMRFTARAFYFNTLCFIYLSFWTPQVYRNIMRNCRKALRWDFVVGQSIVRMVPIAYFYMVEDNVLFARTDWTAFAVLAGWVWIQIVMLFSQTILGSRFFVREGWAPPAYDYHPILREDEEGASMPIGSDVDAPPPGSPTSQVQPGESRTKGKKVFDCSICAQKFEVPVVPADGGGPDVQGLGGLTLQRRAYMVTPCRHIFHTACLEGWMRYRLQCPNCRETLPPL